MHVAGGTTALGVRDGLLRERPRCGDAAASLANFGLNYLFLCSQAGGRGISPSFPAP